MYDANKTVREFAVEVPQATRLFEKLGIDYCCGGGIPLTQACARINISVDDVLKNLADSRDRSTLSETIDWGQAKLSDLVDHIVAKHHVYVKQELPRLDQLLNKVAGKHTEKHPELKQVKTVFARLNEELTSHLQKEETILFPYIKNLEAVQKQPGGRAPAFGSVRNPIHMMEIEHDSAGDALRELRQITSGYTAPETGCGSYKALYQGFLEFEADLHEHIHLENNILFPRAIEMERKG